MTNTSDAAARYYGRSARNLASLMLSISVFLFVAWPILSPVTIGALVVGGSASGYVAVLHFLNWRMSRKGAGA